MSILDTFDDESGAVISPEQVVKPVENFPETVLVTFQHKIFDRFLQMEDAVQISEVHSGRLIPVYAAVYRGRRIAFYHTLLGGAASGALLEEIIAKGGKKFLFFGSCGTLEKTISAGHYIIPTAAYRDEGTSYHYAPPGDYIEVKTAARLSALFDEIGIPYVRAKTWTTDAFYRETINNMAARKKEGCIAVEMECASIMSVGQFRQVDVYQFLYAADSLDGNQWDSRILGRMPDDMRETHLRIALELASRL